MDRAATPSPRGWGKSRIVRDAAARARLMGLRVVEFGPFSDSNPAAITECPEPEIWDEVTPISMELFEKLYRGRF